MIEIYFISYNSLHCLLDITHHFIFPMSISLNITQSPHKL
ncbi:Uncharacterised protein [Pseudoalteromonas nigrifaciens]|nr:Uncharacterised protein [Pseudoalteromonas nigrifaciens]